MRPDQSRQDGAGAHETPADDALPIAGAPNAAGGRTAALGRVAVDEALFGKRETHLYRVFAQDGSLLYVGVTNDKGRRARQHERSPFRHWATRTSYESFPSRSEALAAEAEAIRAESPPFNRTHNAGRRDLLWGHRR